MINPQTANYIIYTCVAVGLAAITYVIISDIQNWLLQRKQYAEAHRLATQNYINGLREHIRQLQNDIRAYSARECEQLDQLDVAGKRIKFLANELVWDSKKTQVLVR